MLICCFNNISPFVCIVVIDRLLLSLWVRCWRWLLENLVVRFSTRFTTYSSFSFLSVFPPFIYLFIFVILICSHHLVMWWGNDRNPVIAQYACPISTAIPLQKVLYQYHSTNDGRRWFFGIYKYTESLPYLYIIQAF